MSKTTTIPTKIIPGKYCPCSKPAVLQMRNQDYWCADCLRKIPVVSSLMSHGNENIVRKRGRPKKKPVEVEAYEEDL